MDLNAKYTNFRLVLNIKFNISDLPQKAFIWYWLISDALEILIEYDIIYPINEPN